MKILALLFTFLFVNAPYSFDPAAAGPEKDNIKVYVFLHESCRICQYYTPTLKALHEAYGSEKIVFEGVFPNQATTVADLEAFQTKYGLPFNMIVDHQQTLTQKLGATVTPEAIVYNEDSDKILYRGRIDDAYFRVGKRRQVTTTSELKDVLEAIRHGEPVMVDYKEAIGCFIRKVN